MKKNFLALVLCFALVLCAFCACSDKSVNETDKKGGTVVENEPVNPEIDKQEQEKQEEQPVLDEQIALDPEDEKEVVNDLGFNNVRLLAGVANALGKSTADMTQDDIDSVRYLGIGPEATGDYTVYVGLMDYAVAYANEMRKEEPSYDNLKPLVKMSIITFEDGDDFSDLGKFKNVEIFEYYQIPIADVSFVKEYKNLAFGYFNNNGITDVSSLSDYNPETLREFDFTNNNVADWTPLEHIKEKVIVYYETKLVTDDNGDEMYIPFTLTLEEYLEEGEASVENSVEAEDEFFFASDDFESLFD